MHTMPNQLHDAIDRSPDGAPAGPVRGSDYAALSRLIKAAGLLERRPVAYSVQIVATLTFLAGACTAVWWFGDSWYQCLIAAVMGIAFTQVAFLGHDGGHQQVFSNQRANDLLGRLTGNLLVGLSYGWWVGKHNRHHAHPNTEGRDPDIGDGVFAFTTDQVAARTGRLGRAVIRRQAWLFFPMLTMEGLNLHVASVRSLLPGAERSPRGGRRWSESVMLGAHLVGYLGGLLLVMSPIKVLAFVAIQEAVFGLYMGSSFAPNHKGMATIDDDVEIDFLRRQVLTSRNVRGGALVDVLLGGLNYQIEHHLFPSMPRYSLRRAQRLVRDYCAQAQVSYAETSLVGSYVAALRHLNQLGAPLRAPARAERAG
jgi:fatty acid desaturase